MLRSKPGYAEAHYNKSHALLLLGEFDKGWGLCEGWRWKVEELIKAGGGKRNFSQISWHGQKSLAGKTILLYSEQGYGDTIQFCRYVKLVANLGARVILEIQTESLRGLLSDLEGVAQLVKGNELPDFDFQCSLLSLPLAFKTNIKTIPASASYLNSDAINVAQWKTRLGEKAKPRIGLAWSGNTAHKNDNNRSFPLSSLVKHIPTGFQYVSLQKEVRDVDKPTLQARPDILNFANELNDFSDTAALCELMDIVISVDTSVAHLAAALGKPTWILLPFMPDWRWLLDRTDTPWYPSAKLYRQEAAGDWNGVFERVGADLTRNSRDAPPSK
jgi:hypothetical protein